MSEHLLKILLTELEIVRLKCGVCGGIIELSLTRLDDPHTIKPACPACGKDFFPTHKGDTPIRLLARAVEDMQKHSGIVSVEFVLPAKS